MDSLNNLMSGFGSVFTVHYLLLALTGCLLGMIVGILPGFGPAVTTALLFPVTLTLGATGALVVMSAVLYGSTYGGTITSVLLNVPGESSSVVTCFDGYPMAQQGKAGVAMSIAAIGGFVACMFALVGFAFAMPITRFALTFGPPEFFALTLMAVALAGALIGRSMVKGLISVVIGLILAGIGRDVLTGVPRLTFGMLPLNDGVDLIVAIMGLFGVAEILVSVERRVSMGRVQKVDRILPNTEELRASAAPIARGTILGFFGGLIPGSPGAATAFASYVLERRLSKTPERFGKGAIEGVAGPESSNNSLVISSMIPLFTLGIPASATMAVMLGVFTVNGLTPGPLLFQDHPDVAWTIIASMVVGNVILLILNIPLVRVWVLLVRVPYQIMCVLVIGFMIAGAYTIANSVFNVAAMLFFGLMGYGLQKLDVPVTPMALTIILGHIMETGMRQSLTMSQGGLGIFFESTSSKVMLALTVVMLLIIPIGKLIGRRVVKEE